jgi:hypothetical protein
MSVNTFDILMIIALGSLTGTGIGLAIGFAARQQENTWLAMTRREKSINITLVIVCSVICIGGLAWYAGV